MKKIFNIVAFCVVFVFFASSCGKNRVPAYVMEKDSVVNILIDMHIIEGMISYENTMRPSSAEYATKYFTCYFDVNNIDKARYDTSLLYYYHDPMDIGKVVNENIVNRLSVIEAEIDKMILAEKKKSENAAEEQKIMQNR